MIRWAPPPEEARLRVALYVVSGALLVVSAVLVWCHYS